MTNDFWKNDRYLQGVTEKLAGNECVCVDFFDTLVFRAVESPDIIFERMAEADKTTGLMPDVHPVIFKRLRVIAEADATAKNPDAYIYDVYRCMPQGFDNAEKLAPLEIETEKRHAYLNPCIYSLVKFLHDKGISVAVKSNSLLPKEAIAEILSGIGFDTAMIETVIAPYGDVCALPAKTIYIGKDYGFAKRQNAQIVYYGAIPNHNHLDKYELERLFADRAVLPELTALRRLEPDGGFFFKLGYSTFGPLLSVVCEKVVSIAAGKGASHIVTFMREGALFADMLRACAKNLAVDITVTPLSISRAALQHICIGKSPARELDKLLKNPYISVGAVMRFFRLPDASSGLDPAKKVCDMTECEISDLRLFLLSDSAAGSISEKAAENRAFAQEYFSGILGSEPYITFDLSNFGTMPQLFDRFVDMSDMQNKAAAHVCLNILPNVPGIPWALRQYEGISAIPIFIDCPMAAFRRPDLLFCTYIVENFLTSTEGSCIGYERGDNGNIAAVLDENRIPKKQMDSIMACQRGILTFQELYAGLSPERRVLAHASISDLLIPLYRLFAVPTVEEARHLQDFELEVGMCSDRSTKLIPKSAFESIGRHGIDTFQRRFQFGWQGGAIALKEPGYVLKEMLKMVDPTGRNLIDIADAVTGKGCSRAVIYGAGAAGRRLHSIFAFYGIETICFVDRDSALHGSCIEGVGVLPLDKAAALHGSELFAVSSIDYASEMVLDITHAFDRNGHQPNIVYFEGVSL